jgi:isoleucyl-tRNA synthetase
MTGSHDADSVHLTTFPVADPAMIDKDLEERMELAQNIASMVLSIRKSTKLRVRQPLNKVLIPVMNDHIMAQINAVKNLILSEVNVKELEYITDTEGILVKKVKPDFKKLGPRYGKLMKQLATAVTAITQQQISTLEKEGVLTISVEGQPVELLVDDVEILSEDIPGWQVASNGSLTVALDVTLTPELIQEGLAREVINRIQNLRKDKGFEVTDKITVKLQSQPGLDDAVERNIDYICSETLARSFDVVAELDGPGKTSIEITDKISTYIEIMRVD